jgi:hypothetical protein
MIEPVYCLFFAAGSVPAVMGGTLIGYIIYDMLHYFTHHSSPKEGYLKDMKIYHM